MCIAEDQPGGPKRCPADTAKAVADAEARVQTLLEEREEIKANLALIEAKFLSGDPAAVAADLDTTKTSLDSAATELEEASEHRELQEQLAQAKKTPAQTHLESTEAALAQSELDAEEARKAYQRIQRKTTAAKKNLEDGETTSPELEALEQQKLEAKLHWDTCKADVKLQEKRLTEANQLIEDEELGRAWVAAQDLPEEERDAYLAGLSDDDIAAIGRYRAMQSRDDINAALAVGGTPAIVDRERDTSVYEPGNLTWHHGGAVEEVEGRLLDADTAIYRKGYGDFYVLLKNGDEYESVGQAPSKAAAVDMANRIPVLTQMEPLPDGATELQREVWQAKAELRAGAAQQAAMATSSKAQGAALAKLADVDESARDRVVDLSVVGPVQAEARDGRLRHAKREREKAADTAGTKARDEALAGGASAAEADKAYEAARRKALGTVTMRGGVIPHFNHRIPPESLGEAGYAALARSGIRAWGAETANDYSVVAGRVGNPQAWGFHGGPNNLQTSNIDELTNRAKPFLNNELTAAERKSLTAYTGGIYRDINAAVTGRDKNPASSIATHVSRIESAFGKLAKAQKDAEPMVVVRGTGVPSGWKGTTKEFLEKTYKPGARIEIGKITSTSTKTSIAAGFGNGKDPYVMAIRSRSGLAVKSISSHNHEDEVLMTMGTRMRCVDIQENGMHGRPTVYLVEEDLVAEAEDGL
ncbi:MAG: hypothetical protein DI630_16525 [Gordonia sp. (in: high G+C Gram-positive bacteria)]|nr:MAG: hypothetical protein DI630_16525 [Gordonia sp. (in: high G+C Gram-positive bacteria)]